MGPVPALCSAPLASPWTRSWVVWSQSQVSSSRVCSSQTAGGPDRLREPGNQPRVSPGPGPQRATRTELQRRENGVAFPYFPQEDMSHREEARQHWSCLGCNRKSKRLPIWVALGKSLPFGIWVSSSVNEPLGLE